MHCCSSASGHAAAQTKFDPEARSAKASLGRAFFYNAIGIPLAAFGTLSPIFAGAAMAFSSFSVVSNALLLKRFRSRSGPDQASG
jgi:hypothetical protein